MRNRAIHQKYEQISVGKGDYVQRVTPSRAPDAYLTGSFESSSNGYIPVRHADLDHRFLYECVVGTTTADGKVASISTERAGPGAIETHLARLGELADNQMPCFLAVGKKPQKDLRAERRHERRLRRKIGASS